MSTTSAPPQPRELDSMAPEAMAAYLRERLEGRMLDAKVAYGQLTVTVAPEALPDAARLCKQDPSLAFDFFDFMSGVDEREEGFAVITHLYSVTRGHHINLRAVAAGGRENPVLPTLTGVYRGANWHERETYDMFGIEFEGHPNLLPRILTIENFEGWPLRKDFLLTSREAKPWPGAKEPEDRKHDDGAGESAASGAPAAPEDKAAAAKAKAERAKAKAAEMRRKKARERAAAEQQPEGGDQPERAAGEETAAGGDAEDRAVAEETPADEGALEDAMTTEAAQTPEGAAEIAGTDIAKDAAAGAVGGDTQAGAPGDQPGVDEPVEDLDAEAALGEGGPATPSGAPGVEIEGRHEGADEQSGDKPAAETPGMDAQPEPAPPARAAEETPAPDGDEETTESGGGDDDAAAGEAAADDEEGRSP